jgi:hypothetical protein
LRGWERNEKAKLDERKRLLHLTSFVDALDKKAEFSFLLSRQDLSYVEGIRDCIVSMLQI